MSSEPAPIPVNIRTFVRTDAEACRRLYQEGRIGGKVDEADVALDLDDIQKAYMESPGGHFWVAENAAEEVIGMIGVQQHASGEGEIRRLRVRKDHRGRGIGSLLLETAIKHCRESHHLKVTLDTFMDREPALELFGKFKFRHSRTRELPNRTVVYFYLDLYSTDQPHKKKQ